MSLSTTYDSLETKILAYLERNDIDVVKAIPGFIFDAQMRLVQDLQLQGFTKVATYTLLEGQNVFDKPSNWVSTLYVNIGVPPSFNEMKTLDLATLEFIRYVYNNPQETGFPKYYTDDYQSSVFYIAPTPDQNYPIEMSWTAYLDPIDKTNQQNWATLYIPNALFYASMIEASIFVKNEESKNTFQNRYGETIKMISIQDKNKILDRVANRSKD